MLTKANLVENMRSIIFLLLVNTSLFALDYLSMLTSEKPWLEIKANSEQMQPVYLGLKPLGIELGETPKSSIELDFKLKEIGEKQLTTILKKLKEKNIIVEGWPVKNDEGMITWAFARFKKNNAWIWFNQKDYHFDEILEPILPMILRTWIENESKLIFNDFLEFDDLYAKPLFGQCVWIEKDTGNPILGWLKNTSLLPKNKKYYCMAISQPSRFNGAPISFHIEISNEKILWDPKINWVKKEERIAQIKNIEVSIKWPESFLSDYRKDVCIFSGECEAIFPISGKRTRFIRKNNAEPNNQLEEIVDYLMERYHILGFKSYKQTFSWRNTLHSNLIVEIPGKGDPVILADHIDTAFAEEVFEKDGIRKSVPGADDNASATAVLLRAAEIFSKTKNKKPIWLLHLTGEEFPADDLGARKFVSSMLKRQQKIAGVVLLDMIGYRKKDDPIFQINAGESGSSVKIAEYALSLSRSSNFKALYRSRFDEKSYLYNTDGIIFSDIGYPVILINEHINKLENIDRSHYHQMTDNISKIDFNYATSIAKVAIQTVMALSWVVF